MTIAMLPKKHNKTSPCQLNYRKLKISVSLSSLNEIFSQFPNPVILGGNDSVEGFSYWMSQPKDNFEFRFGQTEPFEKLQRILDSRFPSTKLRTGRGNDNELPKGMFTGGWTGFFSYDLGRFIEPSAFADGHPAKDDLCLPLIRLCFYDRLIAYDHRSNEFWLLVLHLENDKESIIEKLNGLEQIIEKSKNITISPLSSDDIESELPRCNMTKQYYLNSFTKIKRHIYDGDVYQINFSQRFDCPYNSRPIDLYHWQNHYNPSPYSAYIDAGDFQIVSASPEMFINIKDRIISTKPIKGTRQRFEDTSAESRQINNDNFNQLLTSEKEKAELNMIIDLERNDLARICKPGTRKVVSPRSIEKYPTVFHAMATVAGELRDDVSFCDILKAMFPGGSITGAPKIRSMQIINETEPNTRGIYTGSIGFIGLDGSVCLNIAIRTIIIKNKSAYVQTGGGIVADSEPQAEYDETLIKAKALLKGIETVNHYAG